MSDLNEFELPDGTVRKLGNLRTNGKFKYQWREYGVKDDEPLIPRTKWREEIEKFSDDFEDWTLPYVHDQNGVGQCNCDATAAAVETQRAVQGLAFVKLSAADLYDRINGGSDQGSLLEDALAEMTGRGIGTAATSGTLWKRGFRAAPDSERAKYRVLEFCLLPTFEHVMSASIKGRKLISGIEWASNYTPDSEGWLPPPRGNSGGHAIFGYKPAYRSGQYGIRHQNSWTTQYGIGGRMILPESAYEGQVGGWWAIREVVDEGGVIPTP